MWKEKIVSISFFVFASAWCFAQSTDLEKLKPALDSVNAENILRDISKLASDEFEGREPGTRGETLTVDYLVKQFKDGGLKAGNPDGTYLQKVPLVGYTTVPQISIEAAGKTFPLKFIDDFVHDFPILKKRAFAKTVPIVFAGYGIIAPEYGWDDYKDVDVRDKLVFILSGEPRIPDTNDSKKLDESMFRGKTGTYYATREFKFDLAAKKGAAGILIISDPERSDIYPLFQTFAKMEGLALRPQRRRTSTLISGLVTLGAAGRLLSSAGLDLEKLVALADKQDFRALTTTARANLAVESKLRDVVSRNVIARIDGADPSLKDEHLVYSAHWDHLGKDLNLKGDQIYNGAIDNAVGVSMLLEIARAFARGGTKPKRSILFIATTAEEKGYLGARYYAHNPLVPIAKTVANINLDGGNAWGKTGDAISANYGLSTLDEVLDDAASSQQRVFRKDSLGNGGLYYGSDQVEFAKVGIPSIFPFSGFEYLDRAKDFGENKWDNYASKDYHQVSDEIKADWDLSGAVQDAQWLMIAGYKVVQADERPSWKPASEFRTNRFAK